MDNEFYLSIGGISPEVSLEQGFGVMAGEVLLLNFCAVTNGSASIEHLCYKAATTPSPEPLSVSVKPTAQMAHLVFADTQTNAQKTKRAISSNCTKKTESFATFKNLIIFAKYWQV